MLVRFPGHVASPSRSRTVAFGSDSAARLFLCPWAGRSRDSCVQTITGYGVRCSHKQTCESPTIQKGLWKRRELATPACYSRGEISASSSTAWAGAPGRKTSPLIWGS